MYFRTLGMLARFQVMWHARNARTTSSIETEALLTPNRQPATNVAQRLVDAFDTLLRNQARLERIPLSDGCSCRRPYRAC
jgi:hypothetical protein